MSSVSSHSTAQKHYSTKPVHSVIDGNGEQLDSVMSELNRLSKSFVNSYQTLESQVQILNGQLKNEAAEKHSALLEKQQLLIEKASLSDRLQNLLTVMPAGVVVIDGDGKVKDCNAMAIDILGRPLLGQAWLHIINRAFQPQEDDGHQVSLKDGRKIHIETKALDVEPGQLVVLTDLTKTRQLQSELSQQQKLSSMGKMIASLAHQIRTPLSAAILYGSHLNGPELESGLKQKFSSNLMERLHYIERQINDMLNFVKGERKQKTVFTVKQLFERVVNAKSEFSLPIDFVFDSNASSNKAIVGDLDALVGALQNLIENACDACQDVLKPKVSVRFYQNDQLHIDVIDNGSGISKEEIKKIFEPFYTNKKNGNGLGLAVVYGVVIDHKGIIHVRSNPQQQTQFELSFPLVEQNENMIFQSATPQEIINEF